MADDSLKERRAAKPDEPPQPRRPYVRPQISWREPYEPVAFGVSCALQPGNPPCVVFPSA